jgi:hypothetical protein
MEVFTFKKVINLKEFRRIVNLSHSGCSERQIQNYLEEIKTILIEEGVCNSNETEVELEISSTEDYFGFSVSSLEGSLIWEFDTDIVLNKQDLWELGEKLVKEKVNENQLSLF